LFEFAHVRGLACPVDFADCTVAILFGRDADGLQGQFRTPSTMLFVVLIIWARVLFGLHDQGDAGRSSEFAVGNCIREGLGTRKFMLRRVSVGTISILGQCAFLQIGEAQGQYVAINIADQSGEVDDDAVAFCQRVTGIAG
jgi:hypothetical protein